MYSSPGTLVNFYTHFINSIEPWVLNGAEMNTAERTLRPNYYRPPLHVMMFLVIRTRHM